MIKGVNPRSVVQSIPMFRAALLFVLGILIGDFLGDAVGAVGWLVCFSVLTIAAYILYKVNEMLFSAAKKWGGSWTVPTSEQWWALVDDTKCKWEWKENYSFGGKTVNGCLVSDKNDPSKFIFLPAAGYVYDYNNTFYYKDNHGFYWSSTACNWYDNMCLKFSNGEHTVDQEKASYGMLVRLVSK